MLYYDVLYLFMSSFVKPLIFRDSGLIRNTRILGPTCHGPSRPDEKRKVFQLPRVVQWVVPPIWSGSFEKNRSKQYSSICFHAIGGSFRMVSQKNKNMPFNEKVPHQCSAAWWLAIKRRASRPGANGSTMGLTWKSLRASKSSAKVNKNSGSSLLQPIMIPSNLVKEGS